MSKLKELREKRGQVHAQSVALLQKPSMTLEDRQSYDRMEKEIETLTGDIDRIVRSEKIDAEIRGIPTARIETQSITAPAAEYRAAWVNNLRFGIPGNKWQPRASERSHKILRDAQVNFSRAVTPEQREQLAGTQSIAYTAGTEGGFFVPAGFVYDVDIATQYYAPLLDGGVIRTLTTQSGGPLPYPTSNDTQQVWHIVGEGSQVQQNNSGSGTRRENYPTTGTAPDGNPGDVGMDQVTFGAYKGTTGLIRVSLELLDDSGFNLEAFLINAFAARLGRGYEYYLTKGNGTTEPQGILTALLASGASPVIAVGSSSNDGVTGHTGANSIGYADLVNLEHSVDPTYRRNAKYMFHDQTLRFLKTLTDRFGHPLWAPGMKDGEPDTINGYQYVINQCFPQIGASETTVAFGAWEKFIARKVNGFRVQRLDERFADYGEVAFIGFSRIDSRLVDAGTHPINYLQQTS